MVRKAFSRSALMVHDPICPVDRGPNNRFALKATGGATIITGKLFSYQREQYEFLRRDVQLLRPNQEHCDIRSPFII